MEGYFANPIVVCGVRTWTYSQGVRLDHVRVQRYIHEEASQVVRLDHVRVQRYIHEEASQGVRLDHVRVQINKVWTEDYSHSEN